MKRRVCNRIYAMKYISANAGEERYTRDLLTYWVIITIREIILLRSLRPLVVTIETADSRMPVRSAYHVE